jgi:hypothetical protein
MAGIALGLTRESLLRLYDQFFAPRTSVRTAP